MYRVQCGEGWLVVSRQNPQIPECWAVSAVCAVAVFMLECFVSFFALHLSILLIRIRQRKFCSSCQTLSCPLSFHHHGHSHNQTNLSKSNRTTSSQEK